MPGIKIAILDDYQRVALKSADWASLDADVEVFHDPWQDEDQLVEALADFEIISLLRERTAFPASVLARLPKLKLVSMTGHRTSTLDVDACTGRGILVTFTKAPPSEAAAELAVGLMIACARAIPAADATMRDGRFQEGLPIGRSLGGKRLGIVGLGRLGSRVAKVGLALGMDVVAWSQNLTQAAAAAQGVQRVEKKELFTSSDVVSLHLALSARTKGIVGREEIAALKNDAILINTARASLVEEAALMERLQQGTIMAGLDVYDIEPLPPRHPLLSLPNVVLTPHLGYVVCDVLAQFFADSRDNIAAFLAGRPVNMLNPEALDRGAVPANG